MQITAAELEIMKAVWRSPGSGAAEIAGPLAESRDWNIRTIKTLLARLVEKGALRAEPDGRRYLYHPLIDEEAYQQTAARDLVDRLFGGRAAPLVAHLADGPGLSEQDIAELEALIGKLKK